MTSSLRNQSILWSPREGDKRFIIASQDLRMYEWLPEASNDDNCFDWCPSSNYGDIVAVGLTTGRVVLVPMEPQQVPDGSPYMNFQERRSPRYDNTSITRSAIVNTSAAAASLSQYPTLITKHSRACNVVTFSKADPKYIATGLDKARNDWCLMIWDIEQALDGNPETLVEDTTAKPTIPTEPVGSPYMKSSADFNRDGYFATRENPLNLSKEVVRRPTFVSPQRTFEDLRPLRQYGPSEIVTSCAWRTNSHKQLVAGMGLKSLRLYDLRSESSNPSIQVQSKAVYGIVPDPFHTERFASFTEEGIIRIWDIRKPDDFVLTVSPDQYPSRLSIPTGLSRISFSPSRSNVLASLSRDSRVIGVYNLQEGPSEDQIEETNDAYGRQIEDNYRSPWHGKDITQETEPAADDGDNTYTFQSASAPVLWRSHKTQPRTLPLTSFAWIPSDLRKGSSLLSWHKFVAINRDGNREFISLHEANDICWSSRESFIVSSGEDMHIYALKSPPVENVRKGSMTDANYRQAFSDMGLQMSQLRLPSTPPSPDGSTLVVENDKESQTYPDISVIMRQRAMAGYLMDCEHNLRLLEDDKGLQELWTWIKKETAKFDAASSDNKGRTSNAEITYSGVSTNWATVASRSKPSPYSTPRITSPSTSNGPKEQGTYLEMTATAKSIQRWSGLAMCGSAFSLEELEADLKAMEDRDEHEKAAAWALFHGLTERCIQSLRNSQDQSRRLMSAALAGYQSDGKASKLWQDLCKSLSVEFSENAYLKVIFAYMASLDWREVLEEERIPLRERTVVALRVLNDEDLTTYVNDMSEKLINEGDIQGLFLTGITPSGVQLLQNYVNRTGDIQTASLAAAFCVPRRFKDTRVQAWTENYRELLDIWQLYHIRARFDITRGKRMGPGNAAASSVPPQVYVRCTFCSQSVAHNIVIGGIKTRDGKRSSMQPTITQSISSRSTVRTTVCPSCKKSLPRCALCLLNLGTPTDPLRQAIAANGGPSTVLISGSHGVKPADTEDMLGISVNGSRTILEAEHAVA
ncbi:hypothetical protein BZG36_00690 [Bifiguratus adelaidae]|uniref:MIOS-like alpha-solenoid domain-containing protein n=1 Tax=Bifiguratus adelaidae TaxID=1938954 RepID=A0A261Y795_9FUNG|nr:hypothetical protein BZG36_00690 [Bifiguratus adelaidae]